MFYAGLCMYLPFKLHDAIIWLPPKTILQRSDMLMQSEFFSFRVYHQICVEKQTYTQHIHTNFVTQYMSRKKYMI